VRPAASTAAAAPVGEKIRLDEPGLTAIIEKNNTPVPNNVILPSFTVGDSHYGKDPPENLESDQIIEYNLLNKKTKEQRQDEYNFLRKQQLVLKHNLDKLVPDYDTRLEKYLEPNFFTKYILRPILRPSIQDIMFYDDLATEEIPIRRRPLHNLKTTIDRYKKLFKQVNANLFVHETIRDGKTVLRVYKTKYGIEGGKRTIRRKRSKPAKTYKKHGSYRRRHGKSQTRRS